MAPCREHTSEGAQIWHTFSWDLKARSNVIKSLSRSKLANMWLPLSIVRYRLTLCVQCVHLRVAFL